MKRTILGLAALLAGSVIVTTGAVAQTHIERGTSFASRSGDHTMRGEHGRFDLDGHRWRGCGREHDGGGRHGHGHGCSFGFGYGGYGYAEDSWAFYNNRSWSEDSYNDWWHDRPDRAYPRWMSHNRGCARPWYMGDTLTC